MDIASHPCSSAGRGSQSGDCFYRSLQASDRELNAVYRRVIAGLRQSDRNELVTAQRAWIRYRDGTCRAERGLYSGNASAPTAVLACLDVVTRQRTATLRTTYGRRVAGLGSNPVRQPVTVAPTMSGLPAAIRQAAISAAASRHGQIAGARIGDTNMYVTYLRSESNCGTGGCGTRVWRLSGGRATLVGRLGVSFPPVLILPEVDRGMPRLGLSVRDINSSWVIPAIWDGSTYQVNYDEVLPTNSGRPLITRDMLRPF